MKKIFAFILSVVMMLSVAAPAAAAQEVEPEWSGLNVSTVNPMEKPVPFGTSYPTETYYPHNNEALSIAGSASYSTLWLSKMILGCEKYYIEIYNNSSTPLKCAICRQNSGDIQETVKNGYPLKVTIDADPDEIVCMSFVAPSNFYGSIRCACGD